MYSEKIMDHFLNPRNVGEIENTDCLGEMGNSKCGELIKIYLKINNDIIKDAKFKIFGSAITIAIASIITEFIKDKKVQEIINLESKTIKEVLGEIPIEKLYCFLLIKEAINEAISNYLNKKIE